MRIEEVTTTRTVVEAGEIVFVPEEAVEDSWDHDAVVGVASVREGNDDEDEIYAKPVAGGASFYVKAALVQPWDGPTVEFPLEVLADDDPDDLAHHGFAPGTRVRVVSEYLSDSYLVTSQADYVGPHDHSLGTTAYVHESELATAQDAYAPLVSTVEGPIYVLDREGWESLPRASVVQVPNRLPFVKTSLGGWLGTGSGALMGWDDTNVLARVLFIADKVTD